MKRIGLIAALVLGGLLVLLGAGLAVAAAAGVDLSRRQVPEVRRGLAEYGAEDYAAASEHFEKATTDLEDQTGVLNLDRGLALARLEKADEAAVALRRAASDPHASKEVRSEAHLALGDLALSAHRDLEAVEDYRQALRLWPGNRDAAWNLSLARRRLEIDACRLVEPPTLQATAGQETGEVTGEVVEEFRTSEEGALEGLEAQLGFGPDGSDPNGEGWSWSDAEYSGEAEEGGGERYVGTFDAPELPGRFDYAFRFRQPGGHWATCDLDGSTQNGYTPDQAGDLTVIPPGNRCAMIGPAWLITAPGTASEPAEVAVAVPEGAEVSAVEVGFGPDGSDASSDDGWTWAEASREGETEAEAGTVPAGSPRYRGSLVPREAGRFDYAFRFRPSGSEEWILCDLNGSEDGYAAEGAGDLVARELPSEGCLLDRPPRTQAGPGGTTEPIRALVHQQGEELAPLRVEVGVGPDGSDPSADSSGAWTWVQAEAAEDAPTGWAAFAVSLTAPTEEGSYDYAMRVRRGGQDAAWTYGDLDGSVNGYAAAMAGELIVQEQQSQDQQDQDDRQDQQDQDDQQDQQDQQDQDDQQDQEREDQQDQEQERLPQDMESVLDALQDSEQTFLPPQSPRQVLNDW